MNDIKQLLETLFASVSESDGLTTVSSKAIQDLREWLSEQEPAEQKEIGTSGPKKGEIVKVKIQRPNDTNLDTRFKKPWAKMVERIDKGQKGGYRFVGEWLSLNELNEVPLGAVVIIGEVAGSRKSAKPCISVHKVLWNSEKNQAELSNHNGGFWTGHDWALKAEDEIAELLEN